MISLVVGLGNPGDQYEKTRHNAGFLFVDGLISGSGVDFTRLTRFKASEARIRVAGKTIHLLKPQTYMNKSGYSVAAYAKYYDIPVENILVAHDELDLDPGDIRLKKAGGHGGHNGLRDIINQLSSPEFYRMRIGVGHPGDKSQVSNYVLSNPGKRDQEAMAHGISRGLRVMGDVYLGEYQRVMQTLHTT